MQVKTRVPISNDKLPAFRREIRKLAQPAPDPHAELRARAEAHAAAEGLDAADVLASLARIEAIRAQLGPEAWEVSVGVDYGPYLEYGTSRIPPYPFWRPAFEVVKARFADDAAKELNAAIDRACR